MTYESDSDGELQTLAAEGDTLPIGRSSQDRRRRWPGRRRSRRRCRRASAAAGRHGNAAHGAPAEGDPGMPRGRGGCVQDADTRAHAHAHVSGDQTQRTLPEEQRIRASPLARRVAREQGDRPALAHRHRPRRAHREGRRAGRRRAGAARRADAGAARAIGGRHAPRAQRRSSSSPHPADDRAPDGRGEGDDPRLHVQIDVDMEACMALRSRAQAIGRPVPPARHAPHRPTTTWSSRPARIALREHPHANGGYRDGRLHAQLADQRRRRRRRRGRPGRAHGVRRRREVARRDRPRDARARRARARRDDHPARARRWHLHRLKPRHVRRQKLHRDHQPAPGRDPLGRRAAARRRARGAVAHATP